MLGLTAVLITCSYRRKEFIRIGYYVNNSYEEQALLDNPPPTVELGKVVRHILSDKPRITKFPIDWNSTEAAPPTPENNEMYAQDRNEMMKNAPTPSKP